MQKTEINGSTGIKAIIAIAFPAIISNITTPLLGLSDIAITGHIGGAKYLAAIALGGTVFNMLYWLLGFLRMGTSGLTAQAYGSADRRERDALFFRSVGSALVLALLLLLCSPFSGKIILGFMDADDSARALALDYFRICIWGAPAVLVTFALTGWFIGLQDSRTPMWTAILTNVVNIAVSITLVVGFGMKIEGVAIGTLTAQWTGALYALLRAGKLYRPALQKWSVIADLGSIKRLAKINSDIFLRTACLIAVTLWFTHAGAKQGVDILAANAILLQFFMLFSFFLDGFAFSGEALAGKLAGMKEYAALRTLIRRLDITGLLFGIIFSLIYLLAGELIVEILTTDSSVKSIAPVYLPWVVIIPLISFPSFLYDGVLIGLTATRLMLLAMAAAMIVFFVMYYLLEPQLHNHALWLSFNAYLLTRGLIESIGTRMLHFCKQKQQ